MFYKSWLFFFISMYILLSEITLDQNVVDGNDNMFQKHVASN